MRVTMIGQKCEIEQILQSTLSTERRETLNSRSVQVFQVRKKECNRSMTKGVLHSLPSKQDNLFMTRSDGM